MKRPILIIVSVVVAFVLVGSLLMNFLSFGIGGQSVSYAPGYGGGAPEYLVPQESYASAPLAPSDEVKVQMADFDTSNVQTQERLVIKNADLSIVVADPKARIEEIADMAAEMGGFVVSSNQYTTYYGPNSIEAPAGTIVIRVPSNRLDEALEKIQAGAVDVVYLNSSGQDVTSIYVDLQSQLSAKQLAEKQLIEIMEGATETEAVLAVYTQLQIIQSEIEVLKGQIKYYDESVALSAVTVNLIAEETVQPVEIGGWELQGTANDAVQSLIYFTQGFVQFLITFFLFNLPALILMAIPLYLLFLGGRKLYRKFGKAKASEEKTEEKK